MLLYTCTQQQATPAETVLPGESTSGSGAVVAPESRKPLYSRKQQFVEEFYPYARRAGEVFRLNPVVILAQAAIESGWGSSTLATRYHNFFGITGYGEMNPYWDGRAVIRGERRLKFRVYSSAQHGFMDYARLITSVYREAAELSYYPEVFAQTIAYSSYISDGNGDNREHYRKMMVAVSRDIERMLYSGKEENIF